MSKIDSPFRQVVHREFQRYPIARKNANVILANTAGRVRPYHDSIVERDAVAAVWQHFVNDTVEFQQFFFGHSRFLINRRDIGLDAALRKKSRALIETRSRGSVKQGVLSAMRADDAQFGTPHDV
jgi:hypothetical protein